MAEYMLQRFETMPPSHIKQLRPEQLTRNNTNPPQRWRDIMFSNDLDSLKEHLTPDRRIINWENLEVVCSGKGEIWR